MTDSVRPVAAPQQERYTFDNGPMTLELRSVRTGLTDLGGGILRFDDGGVGEPWKLPYDELLYVISGTLQLHFDGETLTLAPGEVAAIPRGAEVVYEGAPGTTAFYALTPADWHIEYPNGL
ncbi:cupin domain-containing protein [Hoyosella sp. YIM 151337]|uniref:cupin domain-containing protein n=1 Tax=Hoyosella sp. YIM 151337 TaxID=2992742 RepID=UPI002235BE4E|nr:cupin domain-containing protein [Hoyosella sp. YIM 151337]MCW4355207.1 cupin domain-containing protein [Hoyosella sp. YIM 151337]